MLQNFRLGCTSTSMLRRDRTELLLNILLLRSDTKFNKRLENRRRKNNRRSLFSYFLTLLFKILPTHLENRGCQQLSTVSHQINFQKILHDINERLLCVLFIGFRMNRSNTGFIDFLHLHNKYIYLIKNH
jgi:hypothetical protein